MTAWLTGYSRSFTPGHGHGPDLWGLLPPGPHPNPNREKIKGVVCGVRVEAVEDPLMREMRYLDQTGGRAGQRQGHGGRPAAERLLKSIRTQPPSEGKGLGPVFTEKAW